MTDQSSASDTGRIKKQALAAWLQSAQPGVTNESPEVVLKRSIPKLSDELELLLWLYADDLTTSEQEERLWELSAQEPGAHGYLEQIYAADQILSRAGEEKNMDRGSSKAVAIGWPDAATLARLPGVAVKFAENQLQMTRQSGQSVASQYAMARSAGEPVTRMSDEQTLSCGTLKIDVSRRPNGTFDVSLSLSHLISEVDADSLSVQLLANEELVSESLMADASVRFREQQPGSYVVVLTSVTGVLDRFVIDIESV